MSIKAVIVGATGYVGGELLRLLASHPEIELAAAVSASQKELAIGSMFPHLASAYLEQAFCGADDWASLVDKGEKVALFSAAPHAASAHGVQRALALAAQRNLDVRVVDVSADFRYRSAAKFEQVYETAHASPELLADFECAVPEHMPEISANNIGHPGCFATAMLLATVPLFANNLVQSQVFVSAITGSTGSGRKPQPGTHHPQRHANLYAYKALQHRHVPEVENLIKSATGADVRVNFVPHSGPFSRGIYATVQTTLKSSATRDELLSAFDAYYEGSRFIRITDDSPKLKNVVASNFAQISLQVSGDCLVVMCAIDNLVKGAAGGAIQWMNRLWSLPEASGIGQLPAGWS